MEFTNDIFFDKPLVAGNTVILTYFGKLYREHSKDVSIVFGYGDNWEETDNAPMQETENGFVVIQKKANNDTIKTFYVNREIEKTTSIKRKVHPTFDYKNAKHFDLLGRPAQGKYTVEFLK